MTSSLLVTKLYFPPPRPEFVSRPRLIDRMNEGLLTKLTLITAPAGFGKTTLVSEWIIHIEQPVTWLSLDEGDNDPLRFLTYFITALNQVEGVELTSLGMLQSPQPPPTETVLTSLINEIANIPDSFILVLDDYHAIESSQVDDMLTFLLENLPPQLHLVIATREDPLLPLSRLRVRNQLTELRAVDLRFTTDEAAEFLNQIMGLNLSHEDITALETRTEGWIAGLQLAAISMQGRNDIHNFIEMFTGSHRLVLDYLVDEVLNQQDESIKTFLLDTAILERLNGSLCDALTGSDNGQQILEMLERSNLFIIPLDNERQWYRYHHLFADVLQAHLMVEQPNQVPVLHQRATKWFEGEDLWADAIKHALAANDFERVARLAELSWQTMENSFQTVTWLSWVEKLSEEILRTRPVLSTQCASALWLEGELEASEARLRDAEMWLDYPGGMNGQGTGSMHEIPVVDEEQLKILPARIAIARANIAQARGDFSGTVRYAELALQLTPEDDMLVQAQATATLGFTYWASGNLEQANRAMSDWIREMQEMGNIVFAVASTYALADIMVGQGLLQDAVKAYKQSLQLGSKQDEDIRRVSAHQYLGLAMLYHELDEQEAMIHYLQKSRDLGKLSTLADWPYRWHLSQAQLAESRGDLESALEILAEANRLYVRITIPDTRPLEALKARVYIRQGRLAKAYDWVHAQNLSADEELSYLREFEHITLSRLFISEYEINGNKNSILQAIDLLERLLITAEESRRMGSVLEILVVQALAYQAKGEFRQALNSLEKALTVGEPEGYIRLFVDEGPPMADLLKTLVKETSWQKDYVRKLITAFDDDDIHTLAAQNLIEKLSPREIEVLRLLSTDLSGPDIAQELMVELSTFRSHTKNIYRKLDVTNRRTATRKAEDLNLI